MLRSDFPSHPLQEDENRIMWREFLVENCLGGVKFGTIASQLDSQQCD
jgi:hypothetical protein